MIELNGTGMEWLGVAGEASGDHTSLTMVAPPNTDWFNDPQSSQRVASAPALVCRPDGDVQLSARVRVDFTSRFDAAVLFVHLDDEHYAKLCYEFSPDQEPMVVSVVTRGVSDDANGPVVSGEGVRLRVSRIGHTFAFHHSIEGRRWRLTRLFSLGPDGARASIGLMAQSPTGDGCEASFTDIELRAGTLTDVRDGT